MIGTPTIKVHQEVIEAKDHMTQALVLMGGVLQDPQVNTVQATKILLQELRPMGLTMTFPQELRNTGHIMTKLQDLRTTLRVAMTRFQGLHNKDASMMTLRQEFRTMQVNMAPLIEPQDKKM